MQINHLHKTESKLVNDIVVLTGKLNEKNTDLPLLR